MRKFILASFLVCNLMVMAQGSFSPAANRFKANYEQIVAKTRAAGEAVPMAGPFTVVCKVDVSAIAVGNRLKELGAKIQGVFGRNLIVSIPADQLDAMAATEGVLLIDVSTNTTPRTDQTRIVTGTDKILDGSGANLPQAYTGKGVIIGLVDSGFDFTHPGFKDKNGNLRIKAGHLFGNTDLADKSEKITVKEEDETGAVMDLELSSAIITDSKVLLDTTLVKDGGDSHATHCAFIAAGSTLSDVKGLKDKPLGGMAPEAELVFSANQLKDDAKPLLEKKYGKNIDHDVAWYLEFFEYMKYLSDKENKPYVISCSRNSQLGNHNGTSPLANLFGTAAKKGAPIVLCSSNEGNNNMYIHKIVPSGGSLNMVYQPHNGQCQCFYEMEGAKPFTASLGIFDLSAKKEVASDVIKIKFNGKESLEYRLAIKPISGIPDEEGAETIRETLKNYLNNYDFFITVNAGDILKSADSNEKKTVTQMTLNSTELDLIIPKGMESNKYALTYHITFNEETDFSCWLDNSAMLKYDGWDYGVNTMSMGDMNTSGETFTIGAWIANRYEYDENGKLIQSITDDEGMVTNFSSYGTDRAGHTFPDICTPGANVISAINSFDLYNDYSQYQKKSYTNQFVGQNEARDYGYAFASGTSMSTPAAAGIVALWMQAANDKGKRLTCADLKKIAKATADTDEMTKSYASRFGNGKLNAYKGLLYVLDLYTGIPELSKEQPANVTFRVTADKVYAEGAEDGTPVTLYNLSGVIVSQTTLQNGAVSIASLPSGVYALQLGRLGSTLIRK